ncbi:14891_t:CDS:2 [Funneliformis geosporum]|uniref:2,4-dienoyl-CoA reductase [(3E)-enoyl-CoA-producing] n=1 Tax=Funneliformis geosporum TaxID=1117311 RepID=A0A9W4SSS8_9GLOM|nr:14891_t:CDS:2 [Funneliformis geosporum]CAI2180247.1 963_t:CDS:2 [Funneliformis geosporum]
MTTNKIFKDDILKDKVAFVTGGGSGICKGMTLAMIRHGAKAVITSRSQEKLDKAAEEMRKLTQGEILAIAADVRKPEEIINVVEKAIERFGKIDILVNGAAGNFLAPAETLSYRAFRTVIEIDLLGTYNTTKACFPYLKKSKGCIINVSATLHYQSTLYQSHVSAAKAGMDALSRNLAAEWGPYSIRVNTIAPGPIAETEGTARLLPPTAAEAAIRDIPLQRFGTISDIEQATIFLASDAASFITGQIIVVDGGESLRKVGVLPYPESVIDPANFLSKKLGVKL